MALPAHKPSDDPSDLTRRERRKREVRDRIVEAAVTLFEKQGPQATKVDDICELADVAQKTFFNHFATKQHLVAVIATTFLEKLFATLEELREANGSVAERLTAFFSGLAERAAEAGPMHRELVLEVIRVAHLEHHEPAQMRFIHDAFRTFLEDARDELRSDQPIETLTEMVIGSFYVLMLNWVSIDGYPLHDRSVATGKLLAEALVRQD